nr:uncharacterized protein LOC127328550 [Lolium perenne]
MEMTGIATGFWLAWPTAAVAHAGRTPSPTPHFFSSMPEVAASKKTPTAKLVDGELQGGGRSPHHRVLVKGLCSCKRQQRCGRSSARASAEEQLQRGVAGGATRGVERVSSEHRERRLLRVACRWAESERAESSCGGREGDRAEPGRPRGRARAARSAPSAGEAAPPARAARAGRGPRPQPRPRRPRTARAPRPRAAPCTPRPRPAPPSHRAAPPARVSSLRPPRASSLRPRPRLLAPTSPRRASSLRPRARRPAPPSLRPRPCLLARPRPRRAWAALATAAPSPASPRRAGARSGHGRAVQAARGLSSAAPSWPKHSPQSTSPPRRPGLRALAVPHLSAASTGEGAATERSGLGRARRGAAYHGACTRGGGTGGGGGRWGAACRDAASTGAAELAGLVHGS